MDSFLMHYGVKGQQWGVRRYQNEDGTLTEEGRLRYLKTLDKHRQDLYNNMTDQGKEAVNRRLAKGEDFDDAVRNAMQERRSKEYNKAMMKNAATFIAGVGLKTVSNLVLPKHPFVGGALKGYGAGLKFGSMLLAMIQTGGNVASKSYIQNLKMEDLKIQNDNADSNYVSTDKQRKRIGTKTQA